MTGSYNIQLLSFGQKRVRSHGEQFLRVDMPSENALVSGETIDLPPPTLGEFIAWWNNLAVKKYSVLRPLLLDAHCEMLDASTGSKEGCILETTTQESAWLVEKLPPEAVATASISSVQYDDKTVIWLIFARFRNPDRVLLVNVASWATFIVNQETAVSMFPTWHTGRFDGVFADLYEATRGLEGMGLEEINNVLSKDIKSEEIFEAFGIRIPSAQITRLGLIVIICIQLYLFVYLRSLKPLQQGDMGNGVPWIALDKSLLARSMLFTSLVILPVVTVCLLAFHGLSEILGNAGFRIVGLNRARAGAVLLFAVGTAGSTLLAYLIWRHRPVLVNRRGNHAWQIFE